MSSSEYRFVCPDCRETMAVNEPMMDALIAQGCVVCGSAVGEDDFCEADAVSDA